MLWASDFRHAAPAVAADRRNATAEAGLRGSQWLDSLPGTTPMVVTLLVIITALLAAIAATVGPPTQSQGQGGAATDNRGPEDATLELRIRPYATAYLDNQALGVTPLPPVRISTGKHVLRLVNQALATDVELVVMAQPGLNVEKQNLDKPLAEVPASAAPVTEDRAEKELELELSVRASAAMPKKWDTGV